MEKRYYCFPDIHGCFDVLKKALDFVYEQNPQGGKIIFLGDYIDRGPDNLNVIKTVMNPPENWEFVCLMGNHEQMFLDSYYKKYEFYDKNTAIDLAEFSRDEFVIYEHLFQGIDKSIINWMEKLPIYHIEDKNVFAHAYYDDTLKPEEQIAHTCVWQRMSDFESYYNEKQGFYLTHGHTPRKHGPVKSGNRVNLDAGAVFYGRFIIGEYYNGIQEPVRFHEFILDKEGK